MMATLMTMSVQAFPTLNKKMNNPFMKGVEANEKGIAKKFMRSERVASWCKFSHFSRILMRSDPAINPRARLRNKKE
jgi:hypothetical protein